MNALFALVLLLVQDSTVVSPVTEKQAERVTMGYLVCQRDIPTHMTREWFTLARSMGVTDEEVELMRGIIARTPRIETTAATCAVTLRNEIATLQRLLALDRGRQ